MKINPDCPDFQPQIESTPISRQTGKAFGETLTSKTQPNVAAGGAQAPTGSIQGLSRQDLADPVKANAAIDHAIQELMEKEFGAMCTPDREQVAAWLRSDPMMRDALLQRLTS
jgi:hypothetical protein